MKPVNKKLAILSRKSSQIVAWLTKNDPLHQYIVEYTTTVASTESAVAKGRKNCIGRIFVRQGAFRPLNSTVVIREQSSSSSAFDHASTVSSNAMIFGIALALDPQRRMQTLCAAVRRPSTTHSNMIIAALRDACTSQCLWDLANVLGDRSLMKMPTDVLDGKLDGMMPSLAFFTECKDLQKLVADAGKDENLRKRATEQLSYLIAQLMSVVNANDLRPIWLPFSVKHKIRPLLVKRISDAKKKLAFVIDEKQFKDARHGLDQKVHAYVRKNRGKFRLRTHQRYHKAMNYLHSTFNAAKFPRSANQKGNDLPVLDVFRLLECPTMSKRQSMRVTVPEKFQASCDRTAGLRDYYRKASENTALVKRIIEESRSELLVEKRVDAV